MRVKVISSRSSVVFWGTECRRGTHEDLRSCSSLHPGYDVL